MDGNELLNLVKLNLQLKTNAFDTLISTQIEASKAMIEREGIVLDLESVEDVMLVVNYSTYLYKKRFGEETSFPRHLRWALNNRLMSEVSNNA